MGLTKIGAAGADTFVWDPEVGIVACGSWEGDCDYLVVRRWWCGGGAGSSCRVVVQGSWFRVGDLDWVCVAVAVAGDFENVVLRWDYEEPVAFV